MRRPWPKRACSAPTAPPIGSLIPSGTGGAASGSGRPWSRRARATSVIRALLRQQGYRVPSGSAEGFIQRVRALPLPGRLVSLIAPLLAVMRHLNRQLAYSDAALDRGKEGGGGDRADTGDRAQARHTRILDGKVLATMPSASAMRIASKPTSAWCPASTAPARRSTAAPSPRRATRAFAGC